MLLAQDGNLDISNELAEQSWRNFATVAPPVETVVLAYGSQISPHDPLLPLLLAQLYPELSAALACLLGVAAVTGPLRRPQLALLAAAAVALPWPVGEVHTGGPSRRRWDVSRGAPGDMGWLDGVRQRRPILRRRGVRRRGGADPHYLVRAWRVVGLLVDQDFGLGAWQPAWLLVVPALAALAARPPRGFSALALPLLAGWLVATFLANTMPGWWWPDRQAVVVLPLAVLCRLTRTGTALRAAAVLDLAGASTYAAPLVNGWAGRSSGSTASPTSTPRSTRPRAGCCQPSRTTRGTWSGRRCSPWKVEVNSTS